MKKNLSYTLLTVLLLISTISEVVADEVNQKLNAIIAEVNGKQLTVADFQAYIRMRMPNNKQPEKLDQEQRQKIFGEYINRELLYQEALKKRVDQNPVIFADIENQRRNIIVSYALKQLMQIPIDESEIKAVYKQEIAVSGKEYKTRHILVKTEAQAKQIIDQLNKGGNFTQLATKYSIDASGKKGGELAWFSPKQMLESYAEATEKLTNGNYTRTPINTRFGWHIIKLDGTRVVTPPAYDEVKNKIIALINTRRITNYLGELRNQSDISVANIVTNPPNADKSKKD